MRAALTRRLRRAWDQLALYLPAALMGLLALGTYWLARSTPSFEPAGPAGALTHQPDYFMRNFTVKTFDAEGRLKHELVGTEARHYPDTDTLEVDQPQVRSFNVKGELMASSARRALSNADGSEIQLIGDAVVVREGGGPERPRLEVRGEFLHAFTDTERLRSHKPVVLLRGPDRFSADTLEYDNQQRTLQLRGRVRGTLMPKGTP